MRLDARLMMPRSRDGRLEESTRGVREWRCTVSGQESSVAQMSGGRFDEGCGDGCGHHELSCS